MKTHQKGFTLVELIVVIVILGILAATALPRFVSLSGEARAAQMQGIAASMEAAKALVQGKWMAAGSATMATVAVPGAPGNDVAVITAAGATAGMPSAAAGGMGDAIQVPTAVTCTPGATFVCTYTGYVGCTVTYDPATGGAVTIGANAANCN